MAKFYVQLKDKLVSVSEELTSENISKALGYVPSNFSGNFEDLKNNPLLMDGDGELNIIDENGNIIAKINSNGVQSVEFSTSTHKLSEKVNTSQLKNYYTQSEIDTKLTEISTNGTVTLEGYASKQWVEEQGFIKDTDLPLIENESGEFIIVDEEGNTGFKLNADGIFAKDVIADGHRLSAKANTSDLELYATKDEVSGLVDMTLVNELSGKVDTLTNDMGIINQTVQENAANIYSIDSKYQQGDIDVLSQANGHTDIAISNLIKNNPFSEGEDDSFVIVDDDDNIGFKLNANGIFAKDVITPNHILSEKANWDDITDTLDRFYYTKSQVNDKIVEIVTGGAVSLEGYATEEWINEQGFLTEHQDISHLATKKEVEKVISEIPSLDGYAKLSDIPSTDGLASEQWVKDQKYLTTHQDISHLATKSEIPSLDGYAKLADIPSTDGLVKEEDLPNFNDFAKTSDIPSTDGLASEQWVKDQKYLTTHQDISHLATKSEIPSLDGYATEKWIADQGYASDFDLKTLEYNSINNIPLIDDGTGDFIIIDENSHIGAKLSNIGFYAKDFIISTGSLSDALNRISQLETQVADLLARIQVLEGN